MVTCVCEKSKFCNPHHKRIIKWVLRIIEIKKLRKLITKNPNYRKARSINFSKTYFEIDQALICIKKLSRKNKLEALTLIPWRELVLTMVKEKVIKLKQKMQPRQTKSILSDPDVKSYLEALRKRFAIVTIEKASKQFGFICKNITSLNSLQKLVFLTHNLKHIQILHIASRK